VVADLFAHPDSLAGSRQFLALALLFGALATATAPAGTVAVIREYRARGNLTQALYAVVGYDDALAVIIYGFAFAVARAVLAMEAGGAAVDLPATLLAPFREVLLSLFVGASIGMLFCVLARNLRRSSDMLILIVGFILMANGMCVLLHLSFILTNMVFGFVIANTQPHSLVQRIRDDLEVLMPLLFILLFGLAGANLDLHLLPKLGVLGLVYIAGRSAGKILGARVAAALGGLEARMARYLGLGLLSQAGVAIGLALITNQTLRGVGAPVRTVNGQTVTSGDVIGSVLLTTITASCVFFEIVGPILTRIALDKAGEIPPAEDAAGTESHGTV
jgi:Kef-type K+ transport system membrane component KefB